MSKYLALSLVAVSFIFGAGFGYYFTPEYSMSVNMERMDLGQADTKSDLRYLNLMATHHIGAMRLAEQAKAHSRRTEIQDLADAILSEEPKLIAQLEAWKKDWFRDYKPVREPDTVNLGSYDPNFDLRFLNALLSHHLDGIYMANQIQAMSTRNEVLSDAQAVKAFLENSSQTLRAYREQWYGIK